MKVNIAVSGRFHYANYIKIVYDSGLLGKFYFSHKVNTGNELGLPASHYCNAWPKEYLVQAHSRLLRGRFTEIAFPWYGSVWTQLVRMSWQRADIVHAMAHGHVAPILEYAKKQGSQLLVEAVNTHPANQMALLNSEARLWGLPVKKNYLSSNQKRIVKEVSLADRVLVPTSKVAASYIERGTDPGKIVKIPYAANIHRFHPPVRKMKRSESDPLRVICVGAIGLRKGQLHLIKAAQRLGPKAIQLTLVGQISPEVSHLLQNDMQNFVHIPRIDNAQLPMLLHQQDIFVMPSIEEGLAVSICEGMACGLPIIATRESGAEELMVNEHSGWLVPPSSADDLAARLAFAHDNPECLEEMGLNASKASMEHQNWERYAQQLMGLYADLFGDQIHYLNCNP